MELQLIVAWKPLMISSGKVLMTPSECSATLTTPVSFELSSMEVLRWGDVLSDMEFELVFHMNNEHAF